MAPGHRSRSPLRERHRAISPQRGNEVDYGQDAEKHVRHIARTKQLTTFAGEEGTHHGWSWVLKSLVYHRSHRGLGCPVDVLDTVIYGVDGAPEALYCTRRGTVVSSTIGEDDGCITSAKAVAYLRPPKRYIEALTAAAETNGAVAITFTGEAVLIKTVDVEKIRKGQGTPPTGTEALVGLVPSRAPCVEPLLSLQHTCILDSSVAKPVHRSYRLVLLKGASERIPCKSSIINRKLERSCKKVVSWIEAYSRARVLHVTLEFVEDALGELWLVRSSECSITKTVLPYSEKHRSPSPFQSKEARLQTVKHIANDLSILRYGYGLGETASSVTTDLVGVTRSPEEGILKDPGSHQRPHTAMSQAEVSNTQGTINAEEWGIERIESQSKGRNVQRPQTTAAGVVVTKPRGDRQGRDLDQDTCRIFQTFAAPGECDPREVGRTAAAGRALGSSQLGRMCYGDFCQTDLLDKVSSIIKTVYFVEIANAVWHV